MTIRPLWRFARHFLQDAQDFLERWQVKIDDCYVLLKIVRQNEAGETI